MILFKYRFSFFTWASALVMMCLAAALLFPIPSGAQEMTLSSGQAGGSYNTWATQAARVCADAVKVRVLTSDGSLANLDALDSNAASWGLVQADSLALGATSRDVSNLRVLLPLFPEQVHFLVRDDLVVKSGGYGIGNLKAGETVTPITDLSQIGGLTLWAAGGAQATAQWVRANSEVAFQLRLDPGGGKDVMAKVLSGAYKVGIVTGAFPFKPLQDLAPEIKSHLRLLTVSETIMGKLTRIYQKASVSYPGMAQGPGGVATIAVPSLLLTQNYDRGNAAAATLAFRNCLYERASEQAGITGTHPAWRFIKPSARYAAFPMWEPPAGLQGPAQVYPAANQPKKK